MHPEIANPEYNPDDAKDIGKYAENCKIGFDLWQVNIRIEMHLNAIFDLLSIVVSRSSLAPSSTT